MHGTQYSLGDHVIWTWVYGGYVYFIICIVSVVYVDMLDFEVSGCGLVVVFAYMDGSVMVRFAGVTVLIVCMVLVPLLSNHFRTKMTKKWWIEWDWKSLRHWSTHLSHQVALPI